MGKARDRRLSWLSRRGLPSGPYYCVSNYGWGDGSCEGPYSAYEALKNYHLIRGSGVGSPEEYYVKYNTSLKEQLRQAMSDRSMIHYISDYDESDRFGGDDW